MCIQNGTVISKILKYVWVNDAELLIRLSKKTYYSERILFARTRQHNCYIFIIFSIWLSYFFTGNGEPSTICIFLFKVEQYLLESECSVLNYLLIFHMYFINENMWKTFNFQLRIPDIPCLSQWMWNVKIAIF